MTLALYNPSRADLRARVRVFIDEAVQANFKDTDINYALNEAQQQVVLDLVQVAENYFVNTTPTAITLQSGVIYYPLAADFWKMSRLEDVNTGIKIKLVDVNTDFVYLNNVVPPLIANNVAAEAFILGNSLGFRPTPGATGQQVQYWYVPIPPDMQADSDVSVIPRLFIDLLPIRAAIDMFIKDEDNSAPLERLYGERRQQLIVTARDRQQQNPRGVRRSDTGGLTGMYGLM